MLRLVSLVVIPTAEVLYIFFSLCEARIIDDILLYMSIYSSRVTFSIVILCVCYVLRCMMLVGALYSSGDNEITFSNVQFDSNIGSFGGAVYINENSKTVLVSSTTFSNNSGDYGGAIYVSTLVTQLSIDNSIFSNCSGFSSGGCMYIASSNHGISITNSVFYQCRALGVSSSDGGAITVDYGNNDMQIVNVLFQACSTTW